MAVEGSFGRCIEVCFPQVQVRSVVVMGEGWDSVAVLVNGSLVFRFPKRSDVEAQYVREARLLPALAAVLPLPIPDVRFFWPGDATFPRCFLGYELIVGVPGCSSVLGDRAGLLARQLAGFLSALHGFPIERACALGVPWCDAAGWRMRYVCLYQDVCAFVFPLLSVSEREAMAALWEGFLSDDGLFLFQPSLVHQDLTGDHILVGAAGVCGVIDWGDVAIGDPAIDVAGLLYAFGAGFVRDVLAGYRADGDALLLRRALFYRQIIPVHEVLFGCQMGLEGHVQAGLLELRGGEFGGGWGVGGGRL